MMVWLQADQGVELTSNGKDVTSWTSSINIKKGKAVRFEQLTAIQHKMAQETWKKTLALDSSLAKKEDRRAVPKGKLKSSRPSGKHDFQSSLFLPCFV